MRLKKKRELKESLKYSVLKKFQKNVNLYFQNIYELDIKTNLVVAMLEIDYYRSSDEEIIRKCLEELKDELQSKTDMRLWEYHDGVCIIMVEVNSSFLYSFNVQYVIKRSIEYANNHRNMEMMVSAAISITTTI